jgi:hypothetical protein
LSIVDSKFTEIHEYAFFPNSGRIHSVIGGLVVAGQSWPSIHGVARRRQELAKMKPQALEALIAAINECIDQVTAANLLETAALLSMARLDLVARANGITEEELEFFAFALQRGTGLYAPVNP